MLITSELFIFWDQALKTPLSCQAWWSRETLKAWLTESLNQESQFTLAHWTLCIPKLKALFWFQMLMTFSTTAREKNNLLRSSFRNLLLPISIPLWSEELFLKSCCISLTNIKSWLSEFWASLNAEELPELLKQSSYPSNLSEIIEDLKLQLLKKWEKQTKSQCKK